MLQLMVDGDNVTRALKLSGTPKVEEFLLKLEMAAVERDWEVTVFFDGPQRYFPRETGALVVRYAIGKTADSMIERAVYDSKDRASVVVVTQDRSEANMVLGFGARVWTAERLQQEL